jgi:hypothetical protein
MQPNKQNNTRWEKTAADEKHKLKSSKKEIARYPILPRKCPQGDIKKPPTDIPKQLRKETTHLPTRPGI